MKIFVNKEIRAFFLALAGIMVGVCLLAQLTVWLMYQTFSLPLLFLSLAAAFGVLTVCYLYF